MRNIESQLSGQVVDVVNSARNAAMTQALNQQNIYFTAALDEVQKVYDFVGTPESILGSDLTKHGEIAEHVEVGITNARSLIEGGDIRAYIDEAHVSRTGATDYIVDGVDVQSKFYNGINNGLSGGVLGHLEKYPDFTNDGGYYHIPKDQFEIIQKIRAGELVEELNGKTQAAILRNVAQIEEVTGKSFDDVVKPSISNYSDVQQGKVHEVLDNHSKDLNARNEQIKEDIRNDHSANLADGLKATGIAAAVGGGLSFATGLYQFYKAGKNPFKGELTADDWKKLGLDTTKGAAVGGLSGAAIYAMTNSLDMAAPFASAMVGATKGIASLVMDYNAGRISLADLTTGGLLVCSESAVVGLATFAGQTLIPIPVIGGVVGAIAGKIMLDIIGSHFGAAKQLEAEMKTFLNNLDAAYKKVVESIRKEFELLGDLTRVAFDLETNTKTLVSSINLARAYGVEDKKILKNRKEIDDYFFA